MNSVSNELSQAEKHELATPEQRYQAAAAKIDEIVQQVGSNQLATGFYRTIQMAQSIAHLKEALTPEVMKPIMELQGSPLGFRTDRDKEKEKFPDGYPIDMVKECVISCMLKGIYPVMNRMNIIGGRDYITKEGFTYLLSPQSNFLPELEYSIDHGIPRSTGDKGAIVISEVKWKYQGKEGSKKLEQAIRVNYGMGIDAIVGKADRKAKCWLYNHLTGNTLADADADDDVPLDRSSNNAARKTIKRGATKIEPDTGDTIDVSAEVTPSSTPEMVLNLRVVEQLLEKARAEMVSTRELHERAILLEKMQPEDAELSADAAQYLLNNWEETVLWITNQRKRGWK